MLSNIVLMDVDIVSIGVHVTSEDQGGVHERARIDEFAFFSHLHFLDIKYEASVEDLLGQSTFAAKNNDLVVSNLV